MTKKEASGTLVGAIMTLARRPEGYVFTDTIPGHDGIEKRQLYRAIQTLSDSKRIHRLQIGVTSFRYFGNLEDRERLAMDQPERQPKPKGRVKEVTPMAKSETHQKPRFTNQAKVPSGGPARLVGELIFTSKTKFTFGHSPSNPTHTTTHAE
jgi:hypothetical protein